MGAGRLDVVKSLAEKVDLNRSDGYGYTPAHIAAYGGHKEIIKFLADKVDLNGANKYGHTLVWIATLEGHTNLVKFLIEKKVKLTESLLTIRSTEEIRRLITNALKQK